MRAELSDNPITVYMYASLLVAIGVAVAVIDPMFLLLSAWIVPQGLVALLFWRVTLSETGFAIERHGRTELITFGQVESVSRSLCGLPHIVLTLRPSSAIRRVRFFRARTVGSVFFGDYRLKRQLEDIISSAARGAENDRDA